MIKSNELNIQDFACRYRARYSALPEIFGEIFHSKIQFDPESDKSKQNLYRNNHFPIY